MKRGATRQKVYAFIRSELETGREQPSCIDVGAAVGVSGVAAWKHIQTLIGMGKLINLGSGRYKLSEKPIDLCSATTEQLRGELARRGVTKDALVQPRLLMDEGRPCAADGCATRVRRGHLMCWNHWTALPQHRRDDILTAFRGRDTEAYQDAVEAARNFLGGYTRVVERVE